MRSNSVGLLQPSSVGHVFTILTALVSLGLMSGTAVAQPITDTHVPFPFTAINPCNGETFTGSLFLHLKSYIDFTPNGHISVEFNVEDAKGTTTSGVRYVVNDQQNFHLIFDIPDLAPLTQTSELMIHFIREGQVPGDDFYFRFKAHLTINSNGVVTVLFSDPSMSCK